MNKENIKKVVLAYSGGLDTSIIIPWLKENYNNCEVIAVSGNVGQADELEGLEEKALATGASKLYILDQTDEYVDDFIIPTMKAGAVYEEYLLGTSHARPCIAKGLAEIAIKEGADAIAHGCTGKGNDQVRFELALKHFCPDMPIIAPWREWDIKSREEEIEYAEAHNIQPSEIMKVSLVLILAWYIDKYRDKMKKCTAFWETYKYGTLFPALFVGVACGLVILEKHLSGTVILGVLGLAVMIVGGCHLWYTLATALAGGTAAVAVFLMANPYALKRITTFTSENADKLGEAWQTTQGILAIGSGGLFGVGFSESRQKFGYVSMAHNDFIFTIWCEELGFVGAVLLIALFGVFVWRGYVIAMRAPDTFSMLTVFGITTQVGLQAFLNMMVVCDIIPNTGISLPFFSYGGSSLIMLMVEMGLILSISRQYYRKKL